MHDIIFFNFLSISVFLGRFASWERYCNYPLTITQADRFASCENTVSRSQTSFLPPPPPPPRWFNWIKPVLKTVSHVRTSKILEVSKEHAQRKSRAAFRRGFSRGVTNQLRDRQPHRQDTRTTFTWNAKSHAREEPLLTGYWNRLSHTKNVCEYSHFSSPFAAEKRYPSG